MLYSLWLLVIYFPELYISILTPTIKISLCDCFFNKNILTPSIILRPGFSKYLLRKVRNIFPIQRNKQQFEYFHKHSIIVTYFRKAKQTWTRIRKKTLERIYLRKAWFSQQFNTPCWSLPTTDDLHMRS